MRPILSREQMRAFDQAAIRDCSVPSVVLMENAGRGATDVLVRELERRASTSIASRGPCLVIAGLGNNGGDGFVVARQLWSRGHAVEVVLAGKPEALKGDAHQNYAAFVGLGGTIAQIPDGSGLDELDRALRGAGSVVDALLGTGLDRDVQGTYRAIIERMNAAKRFTCALDIPSGIDSNTGRVLGAAVRADVTVTFAHYKLGLMTGVAAEYAGRVEVAHIGIPADSWRRVGLSAELVESADVAATISARTSNAHKSSAGRVVAFAGSPGKTGAALLLGGAALRAGAGLVTIAGFPETTALLDQRVLEVMTTPIDSAELDASLTQILAGANAVAVGPGLGLDARARDLVERVLSLYEGTVVLDADALSHFAGRLEQLKSARGRLILTPHPGEMGRLLGCGTGEVEADRFAAVARCVASSGAVVLLKGPRTIVGAPDRTPVVNGSGTAAMATAGAGDVLTGITSAFACSLDTFSAAYAAAHVHGLAGERWVARQGADRGLLAHELADAVPSVLAGFAPVS